MPEDLKILISYASLKDGQEVKLRPILPDDNLPLLEMTRHLSPESVYYRFFGYIQQFTLPMMQRYTHIDYQKEMAIVAEIQEETDYSFAGVGRIVGDDTGRRAEFAVIVADPYQGLGLGRTLSQKMTEVAIHLGFDSLYAHVLRGNEGMLHIMKQLDFTIRPIDYQTLYAEKKLSHQKE